jgi:hypothetical protein
MTGDPWAASTVVGGLQAVSGTGPFGEPAEGTKDGGAQSEDLGGCGWVLPGGLSEMNEWLAFDSK